MPSCSCRQYRGKATLARDTGIEKARERLETSLGVSGDSEQLSRNTLGVRTKGKGENGNLTKGHQKLPGCRRIQKYGARRWGIDREQAKSREEYV